MIDQSDTSSSSEAIITKLVAGDIEAPVLEMYPCDRASFPSVGAYRLDDATRAVIGDLLRAMPGVVNAGAWFSTDTFSLQFAPGIMARLRDGTAEIMCSVDGIRAIAVDSNGLIIGQGTLVQAPGLSSFSVATVLWQTLTIVTAQHYLHDMQAQMKSIREAINELKEWVIYKEQATLESHMRYLNRIVALLNSHGIQEFDSAVTRQTVEDIERECNQVLSMMMRIMQSQHNKLKTLSISSVFHWDVEQRVYQALEYGETFYKAAETYR